MMVNANRRLPPSLTNVEKPGAAASRTLPFGIPAQARRAEHMIASSAEGGLLPVACTELRSGKVTKRASSGFAGKHL